MRMIQVGAGVWGASWSKVIQESPDWELAALVDPDEDARNRVGAVIPLAKEHQYGSLAEAAAKTAADAALVVVPPAHHAEVALEGLRQGLHCLVEKPLAASVNEAQQVVQEATEAGRTLMASQNFRFGAPYRTVQRLVHEGAVGHIEAVYVDFQSAPGSGTFRLEMEEPLIVDMAVHHLDQLRGLLPGKPVEVRAHSFNPSWSPFNGNMCTTLGITWEDGAVITYTGNWAARGPYTAWDGHWHLQGEEGAIMWRGHLIEIVPPGLPPSGWRRRLGLGRQRMPHIPVTHVNRAGVLAEFAAAIREGREPETSGRENLGTLELVFGAVESARSGQPVRL
jgi:predicted dehydrogenase